jgi:hypothetical protein
MPPSYIPSVRARRLARSLREARESAGFGVTSAAAQLGWSQGKVSHIESCRNKAAPDDVALMLDMYGVTTPDKDALLALACQAEHRGWWTDYVDVFDGPYVALEDAAAEICSWSPLLIPGLLQTQDYARAVVSNGGPDSAEQRDIERRMRARMARQTILTRDEEPPRLHVILDEALLHRPIGGAEVLRHQMYRLKAEAGRPNVTIQVLPITTGAHAGLDGQFILLRFSEPADPDVAYTEGVHGAVYLENPRKVADCTVAFERLCEAALDQEESVALIDAAAEK